MLRFYLLTYWTGPDVLLDVLVHLLPIIMPKYLFDDLMNTLMSSHRVIMCLRYNFLPHVNWHQYLSSVPEWTVKQPIGANLKFAVLIFFNLSKVILKYWTLLLSGTPLTDFR